MPRIRLGLLPKDHNPANSAPFTVEYHYPAWNEVPAEGETFEIIALDGHLKVYWVFGVEGSEEDGWHVEAGLIGDKRHIMANEHLVMGPFPTKSGDDVPPISPAFNADDEWVERH